MVHTRDLRHEPWRYRLRAFVSKPANLLLVFFLIVLVLLSLLPMATMLSNMFTVHVGTEKKLLRLPVGSTTLWHFQKLFAGDDWSQVNFWQPLCNSLIVALGSGILGIAVGGTVAWFITRSDLKCKKFISAVFVFPYMMPAWTLALFWTNMFQNSQVGGGNIGMVESIFGVCMPEWFVYGLFPMIIVTGLHYSPFAYLLIGGILKNMDATLEESATILKASRATIIRRVTIPIVMPAILSTFLLIFSSGFSSYTVPVFLGSAVKCYTLSTKMRALIQAGYQGQGYIIAFVSILLGCLILGVNQRFTGKRKSFTTVTGKSGQVSLVKLHKANWPISILLIVFTAFFAIMPLISFALESVIRQPGNYSPSNMTLHFWIGTEDSAYETGMIAGILLNTTMWGALLRQVLLALVVSAIVGTCGMLGGHMADGSPPGGAGEAAVGDEGHILIQAHARDGVRDHLPRRRHIREFQIPLRHLRRAGAGGLHQVPAVRFPQRREQHDADRPGNRGSRRHLRRAVAHAHDPHPLPDSKEQHHLRLSAAGDFRDARGRAVHPAGALRALPADHDALLLQRNGLRAIRQRRHAADYPDYHSHQLCHQQADGRIL